MEGQLLIRGLVVDGDLGGAFEAGIVDAVSGPDDLITTATELAAPRLGKQRAIVSTLKGDLYAAILATLE